MARQIAEKREARERAAMQAQRRVRRTLEDFMASMEKGKSQELNLILKGDVSGSVEALQTQVHDAVKSVIDTSLSPQNACLYTLGAHIAVAFIATWAGARRPQWD